MFEKYGIRDFISSILKNAKIIIVVMVVFAIVGAGYTILESRTKTIEKTDVLYSRVAMVYIQIPKEPLYPNEQNYFTFSNNIINAYVSLTNTEPAKQYIYDKLKADYSNEVLEKCEMVMPDELKNKNFYDHMIITSVGTAPVIKIISTTTNEKISTDIVAYAVQYIQEKAFVALNLGEIKYTEYNSITSKTAPQNEYIATDIVGNLSKKTLMINIILFAVLGAILSIGVIFVCTLLRPTINRKSDLEAYEVTVLGEVKNKKGE